MRARDRETERERERESEIENESSLKHTATHCNTLQHTATHAGAQGEVQRYKSEEACVRVQLLTAVPKGHQVYVFYGALTSAAQLIRCVECENIYIWHVYVCYGALICAAQLIRFD